MSRNRQQVQRLDPSPEIVAAWNNTSGGPRSKSTLRLRAAAAAASAAAAAAGTAGRKRPRPVGLQKLLVPNQFGLGRTLVSGLGSSSSDGRFDDEESASSSDSWQRDSEFEDDRVTVASDVSDEAAFASGTGSTVSESPQFSTDDERDQSYPQKITVRLARCKMPYRWAEPLPKFESCLRNPMPLRLLRSPSSSNGCSNSALMSADSVLRGAVFGDAVEDETWLTSSFIDIVLAQFAARYRGAHFMPIEFAAFRLARMGRADMQACTDILGQTIDYSARKPIIFLANVKNLHWNLLRVQHSPVPELQLFEPLGKPAKRAHGAHSSHGVSYRYLPKDVFVWLDTMYPLQQHRKSSSSSRGTTSSSSSSSASAASSEESGWAARSISAITSQQQTTGFDCGVASLLYAEKCGQDQMREDIDAWTTQEDMTAYRQALQKFLSSLAAAGDVMGEPACSSSSSDAPSAAAAAASAIAAEAPAVAEAPVASAAAVPAAVVVPVSEPSPILPHLAPLCDVVQQQQQQQQQPFLGVQQL
jgi:hypothetical protein